MWSSVELRRVLSDIICNRACSDDEATLRPVPLLSLLPINLNNYYRYHGSMTSPPCSEVVSWTVFHELVDISARQVRASVHFAHNTLVIVLASEWQHKPTTFVVRLNHHFRFFCIIFIW